MLAASWVTAKDWIRHTATVPRRVHRWTFFLPPSSCDIFFIDGNTTTMSCMMMDIEM